MVIPRSRRSFECYDQESLENRIADSGSRHRYCRGRITLTIVSVFQATRMKEVHVVLYYQY